MAVCHTAPRKGSLQQTTDLPLGHSPGEEGGGMSHEEGPRKSKQTVIVKTSGAT
jgi:hypothetical protein